MSNNSVDGFLPTVVSPILLVLGYCIIIPYGILKKTGSDDSVKAEETSDQANTTSSALSSNIKTS
jgi:hypothetical protein